MALSPETVEMLNKLNVNETREALRLLYRKLTAGTADMLVPGAEYEVSSVYDADEAAQQLLGFLEEHKRLHGQD